MLDRTAGWRNSSGPAVTLALATSVFFALIFWVWERELLWMLAILLPPIWSPVFYRYAAADDPRTTNRVVISLLALGLVALLGVAVLVFFIG